MFKYLLVATDINHTPARYFVGYKDVGALCMTIWTTDFWKAKWFNAEDAEIEAMILSDLCPNHTVEARQVNDATAVRR
jgi:hypothetical protein